MPCKPRLTSRFDPGAVWPLDRQRRPLRTASTEVAVVDPRNDRSALRRRRNRAGTVLLIDDRGAGGLQRVGNLRPPSSMSSTVPARFRRRRRAERSFRGSTRRPSSCSTGRAPLPGPNGHTRQDRIECPAGRCRASLSLGPARRRAGSLQAGPRRRETARSTSKRLAARRRAPGGHRWLHGDRDRRWRNARASTRGHTQLRLDRRGRAFTHE